MLKVTKFTESESLGPRRSCQYSPGTKSKAKGEMEAHLWLQLATLGLHGVKIARKCPALPGFRGPSSHFRTVSHNDFAASNLLFPHSSHGAGAEHGASAAFVVAERLRHLRGPQPHEVPAGLWSLRAWWPLSRGHRRRGPEDGAHLARCAAQSTGPLAAPSPGDLKRRLAKGRKAL